MPQCWKNYNNAGSNNGSNNNNGGNIDNSSGGNEDDPGQNEDPGQGNDNPGSDSDIYEEGTLNDGNSWIAVLIYNVGKSGITCSFLST